MKRLRKYLGILSALLLAASLLFLQASPAAASEEYTYTVRFFAGKQGTISGGEVLTFTGLHYGDRVTFNQNTVKLKDDGRYYIRGIRVSGRDNNTVNATSFQVTEDRDYVVAYGILGSAAAYTINYVDEDGNTLAPSETYYGNVGDMPVIAYLYIENYQPQAYNLVKTLSENEAENVFTFIYTPLEEGEEPENQQPAGGETNPGGEENPDEGAAGGGAAGTGTEANPGGGTAGGGAAGGAGAAGAGAAGAGAGTEANPGGGAAGGNENPGGLTEINDGETPAGGPDNYQNLDDPEVPLSGFDGSDDPVMVTADASSFGKLPLILSGGAVVGAGFLGWWFVFIKKKRKKDEAK